MRVALSSSGNNTEVCPPRFRMVAGGIAIAVRAGMSNHPDLVELADLANVHGGMRWEDLPPSQNVEDRRGMSRAESMRPRPYTPPPAQPPVARFPGDLPSQLGLDDIGRLGRRR
jgi:hypothetical protein